MCCFVRVFVSVLHSSQTALRALYPFRNDKAQFRFNRAHCTHRHRCPKQARVRVKERERDRMRIVYITLNAQSHNSIHLFNIKCWIVYTICRTFDCWHDRIFRWGRDEKSKQNKTKIKWNEIKFNSIRNGWVNEQLHSFVSKNGRTSERMRRLSEWVNEQLCTSRDIIYTTRDGRLVTACLPLI